MSQRVWVVLDQTWRGNRYVEVVQLGTVAFTRAKSIELYEGAAPLNDYAEDRRNGWVRCVTATLIPKAQSKRRPRARSR